MSKVVKCSLQSIRAPQRPSITVMIIIKIAQLILFVNFNRLLSVLI